MEKPPVPPNEEDRLAALRRLSILDSLPEERFDRLTRLAMALLDTPIALFTLVDRDRQWFKSRQGINDVETPRDISFCAHAIVGDGPLVVPNTEKDPRFRHNPQVTGGPRYRSYAGHPVRSPEGQVVGTLCVLDRRPREFRDRELERLADLAAVLEDELRLIAVDEVREELESALAGRRDAEERLRLTQAIVDHSPAMVMVTDPDGRIELVNPAFTEITGFEEAEVLGRSALDLGKQDAVEVERMWTAITAGEVWEGRFLNRNKGGDEYWEEARIYPVKDGAGRIARYVKQAQDITLRKEAQDRARLLEKAVETAPVGILVTDPGLPDNPVVYANPGFTRVTGYSVEEVIGRNCRFLQGEDTDPETVVEIRRAVEKRRPFRGDVLNYRKDGTPFWNQLTIAPVKDRDGGALHFVGAQSDVTARKREEEELENLVEERLADLRRSEEALRESREQFFQSQKMEAVGRLAGGVAHDFNNMLSAILGFSELALQQVPEDHPVHEDLREVRDAGQRAAALTRQLLAFSRKQVLAPRWISLNETIRGMETMLGRLLRESTDLRLELAEDLPRVEMDPTQLQQVLLNLAVNAGDAMPDGGELVIRTQHAHDGVCLSVTDTGVGMDAETVSHAFEPFFTTKEAGKGTGLGLSTVYGIVEQSGGHVSVESSPGKGSRFEVWLPTVGDDGEESPPEAGEKTTGTSLRARVLLVEDEGAVRRLARRCLEEAGCEVVDVAHGKAALETFVEMQGRFDLVITDLVMPGMGGRDLAGHLLERSPGLPVLFMTGYTDEPVFTDAELDRRSALIQKPVTPTLLLESVRALLS